MSLPVIVLGAGGHARVLLDAIRLCAIDIIGVTDSDPAKAGISVRGITVIGGDDSVFSYASGAVYLVNGLGSVGSTHARRKLFEKFKQAGYHFGSIIHPSATISGDAVLGEGVQVMAGAVIQTGAQVGEDSIINTNSSVDHDCIIGAHVHVAPGATLSGQVRVGDRSHIGAGATVIQGRCVGNDCVVGAGAVVLADVPTAITVVGNPARELRK